MILCSDISSSFIISSSLARVSLSCDTPINSVRTFSKLSYWGSPRPSSPWTVRSRLSILECCPFSLCSIYLIRACLVVWSSFSTCSSLFSATFSFKILSDFDCIPSICTHWYSIVESFWVVATFRDLILPSLSFRASSMWWIALSFSDWLELNTSSSIFSSSVILCSTSSCSFSISISLVRQLASSALVFSADWTVSARRRKSCTARVAFMRATVFFFISLVLGDSHSNSKANELIPEDREEPFDSRSNCRVFGFTFSSM